MCGIAGFLHTDLIRRDEAIEAVELMCNKMLERGPDANGLFFDEGIVLGHRRLSILDLNPRSNQPLTSEDNNFTIIFNGEIYNFRQLRTELRSKGIQFRTDSDTEVLLELYRLYGESFLHKLQGMFAFAIWDRQKKNIFLARDAYGIKPLYYSNDRNRFIFASQVKALQASRFVSNASEYAGLAGFYLWGSVPEPWTCIEGVFALEAGHCMTVKVDSDGVNSSIPRLWHDIRNEWLIKSPSISKNILESRVKDAVTDSIRRHLVSDVPIGVFLSGGIDSAVVAGIASQFNSQIEGITIGFKEFEGSLDDEVPLAREIANYYGIKHHIRMVTRDEFLADLPLIKQAMDQPSIDGINTWFASKAAAERGYKVVLSGIGGDELFAGYPSFSQIPILAAFKGTGYLFRNSIGKAIAGKFARFMMQPKLADFFEFVGSVEGLYFLKRGLFLPGELPFIIGAETTGLAIEKLGGHPPLGNQFLELKDSIAKVGMLESTQYLRNQLLRDSDWASMAHSIELRTPLVDATLLHELARFTPQFSRGVGKKILANSPKKPLPQSIINRPKTGFSIPQKKWIVNDKTDFDLPKNFYENICARTWALNINL